MKRKAKYVSTDPEPGTTRLKRVFAWTPKNIDGTIVWLEYFEVLQAFIIFEYTIVLDKSPKKASVGRWEDISNRVI